MWDMLLRLLGLSHYRQSSSDTISGTAFVPSPQRSATRKQTFELHTGLCRSTHLTAPGLVCALGLVLLSVNCNASTVALAFPRAGVTLKLSILPHRHCTLGLGT